MSDHIPFEIQIEVMKKLPAKSLMRFRSVSVPWNSLIDSSGFIADYNLRQTQPHLFITYEPPKDYTLKYVSIVDDDKFPQHKNDITATVPNLVKQMSEPRVLGSSQGLLCFYEHFLAVIWNPWIRKSVNITVPDVVFYPYRTVVGFGVCPKTCDPKLVKITFPVERLAMETWKVEIFSLSSGLWRSRSFSKIGNLICKSFQLSLSHQCVNGFIYWRAEKKDAACWVIISFDLTNEEFGVIYLPDSLERYRTLNMSKLRESLVLLPYDYITAKYVHDVWMMEGGVTKSFHKRFSINSTYDCMRTLSFNYKGESIMEMLENITEENVASLKTYEPSSKHFKSIRITGIVESFFVCSYKETLLLHDYVSPY